MSSHHASSTLSVTTEADLLDRSPIYSKFDSLPEPYNAAYPHPITAYASPGVNPHTVRASGYDKILLELLRTNPDYVKGTILASSDRNVNAPALMIPTQPGEGCGIPERLWSRFESLGAARLPIGLGGIVQSPRNAPPPRFSEYERQIDHRLTRRHSEDRIKTELCPGWRDTGSCKFGPGCPYAHGLNELRGAYPTPPYLPSDLPSRLDQRRASCPPRELDSVDEVDAFHLPDLSSPMPRFAPIGAERRTSNPGLPPIHARSPFTSITAADDIHRRFPSFTETSIWASQ